MLLVVHFFGESRSDRYFQSSRLRITATFTALVKDLIHGTKNVLARSTHENEKNVRAPVIGLDFAEMAVDVASR